MNDDDIPVVSLELLDEVEEKLQESERNEARLRNKVLLHEEKEKAWLKEKWEYEEKMKRLDAALKGKSKQLVDHLNRKSPRS